MGRNAERLDLGRCRIQRRLPSCADRNRCSGAGKAERNGSTDPPAAARDNTRLPLKLICICWPCPAFVLLYLVPFKGYIAGHSQNNCGGRGRACSGGLLLRKLPPLSRTATLSLPSCCLR